MCAGELARLWGWGVRANPPGAEAVGVRRRAPLTLGPVCVRERGRAFVRARACV